MYVVRRPFRNYGQVVPVGTHVNPTDIKRFKSKLAERVIVEVTDSTFDKWAEYFYGKLGVKLVKQPNGEQPNGEQPNGEQPNGEQPNGEQPNGEQPNGEQPNGEQPKTAAVVIQATIK